MQSTVKTSLLYMPSMTLLACLICAGCNGSNSEQPTPAKPPATAAPMSAKSQPQADPLAAMSRAVVLSNANAEVELSYDIASKPVLGQPVEIKLMVVPTADAQTLAVDVSATQPVQLGGQLKANFSDVKLGQINPHGFTLAIPKEAGEGIFLAKIAVSLTHGGATSSKSFAIPVIFSKAQPVAPPVTAGDGTSGSKVTS